MRRNTRSGPSDLVSRRAFLGSSVLAGAALAAPLAGQSTTGAPPPLARPDAPPDLVARNEVYWRRVAAHYRVSDRVTNLEGGYWGMMAVPVLAEYVRQIVRRTGLERGDCVRVTPSLYNGPADVDRLAAALKQLSLERR